MEDKGNGRNVPRFQFAYSEDSGEHVVRELVDVKRILDRVKGEYDRLLEELLESNIASVDEELDMERILKERIFEESDQDVVVVEKKIRRLSKANKKILSLLKKKKKFSKESIEKQENEDTSKKKNLSFLDDIEANKKQDSGYKKKDSRNKKNPPPGRNRENDQNQNQLAVVGVSDRWGKLLGCAEKTIFVVLCLTVLGSLVLIMCGIGLGIYLVSICIIWIINDYKSTH